MKIVYFTHSLRSCWNHGNAHFVRGVLRELKALGHEVMACEPEDAWSLANLLADQGEAGLAPFQKAYPELASSTYREGEEVAELTAGADVVIVHEWTAPVVVAELGRLRAAGGRFLLLFHDTHHRAVSAPHEMSRFDLDAYDGVLAFGESLAELYRLRGWGRRAFVWHEAADVRLFHPPEQERPRSGLVWIGNWGDGERTAELERFLLRPAYEAELPLDVYGVRYPASALSRLRDYGATYRGWLANAAAPEVYARSLATIHVPRRFYASQLPGIPTIRVFEALACGLPLASAPWADSEGLFRPGRDFLVAHDGQEMAATLRALKADAGMRRALAAEGLNAVRARHTCAHRARELLAIVAGLTAPSNERIAV